MPHLVTPPASACPPIISVSDYPFCRDDRLFVDANVWLFAYGSDSSQSEQAVVYEQVVSKMLAADCQLYTNLLILSEYTNRRARMEWKKHRGRSRKLRDFKNFRESEVFRSIAEDIASDAQKILSRCQLVDGVDIAAVRACLADYQTGAVDFNDAIIVQICRAYKLKLVTDDADFARQKNLTVITGNQILLA